MGKTHILVLPFPAQGHVNPLMHFSRLVSDHGIKVTFVNTDFIHRKVVNAMRGNGNSTSTGASISLASIPDGLANDDERNDFGKLFDSILATMPQKVKDLINELKGDDGITCIVADVHMAWIREIAVEFGLQVALLCPASAAMFTLELNIPGLIKDGLVDSSGFPTEKSVIHLSSTIPSIDTKKLPWSFGESTKSSFKYLKKIGEESQLMQWKMVNSTSELESGAFKLSPSLLPIGPLMANYDTGSSGAQFWQEDLNYLKWLDQQQPNSVIYVSFGSITIFNKTQLEELAAGLELINKPFLWVVRPDMTNGTPNDAQCINGKVVSWVSQQKVLKHPAIACFVSHCGWNSTIEGVTHGVPFLCWPFFADQFINKDYICDVWKVGLELKKDESELVMKEEVKQKVEKLLSDEIIKERSLKLKYLVRESIAEHGQSSRNLTTFINWLKK